MSKITSNIEEELVGVEKVRVMLESLKSPNILVRSTGAQNLTDLAIEQPDLAIPILLEALENREWYSVRFGALESLSGVKLNDDQTQKLISYLDDSDIDFAGKVAESLGFHANPISIEPLLKHLNSKNTEFKEFIIIALGHLKDRKAIPELIKQTSKDNYIQSAILKSLGSLGENDSNFNIEYLIPYLNSNIESIFKAVASSLGKIQNPNSIVPLIRSLKNQSSTPEGRNEVINALRNFSSQDIELAVRNSTDDINTQIDLIKALTYHIEMPSLLMIAEKEKEKLIGQYSRVMRRMGSEIDTINAFVADTFKKLNLIKTVDKLDVILDSIPNKRSLLEKIDFKKVQNYQWVKDELFNQLKQAMQWYELGSKALKELEIAVTERKLKLNSVV
ncbi:MAG: hypothetical protein HeimC3_38880 [Candidatus Heimdallarchaeota archaeon LC_3]|nr:MAG: hypothetical protein HeimC3_38880 [Candidatus Heimdallarchaeota archaeon LC_3]